MNGQKEVKSMGTIIKSYPLLPYYNFTSCRKVGSFIVFFK